MTPHSLSTVRISKGKPPVPEWERRFGRYAKGAVLPETRVQSCPPRRVADFRPGFLKQNHIDALEHNQKIASCCRHPENHTVEGFKSHPDEPCTDIYEFVCTCGRRHRFMCVGMEDARPEWK